MGMKSPIYGGKFASQYIPTVNLLLKVIKFRIRKHPEERKAFEEIGSKTKRK